MGESINTNYTKLYNRYYQPLADQVNYKISDRTKILRMSIILKNLTFEDYTALTAFLNTYSRKSRAYTYTDKQIYKWYEVAIKHIYHPKNIAIAIPKYYKVPKKKSTLLRLDDFNGKKYILNALDKKSNFIYREQLLRHLSNGYHFLWTIPGCGDEARKTILMALDKWRKES